MRRLSALLLPLLFACSDADAPVDVGFADADADAGAADTGNPDTGLPDTGAVADAGPQDAGSGLPSECIDECRAIDASIDFGGTQGGFQHAFYGLTAPEDPATDPWTLHVEILASTDGACPTESSPDPDWNLILGSVPLPLDGAAQTDLSASFLDLDGRFLTGVPVSIASAVELRYLAADVCTSCVGGAAPSHAEGFVAFEVSATFEEGTITGHVFATHCDSFDLP